MMLDRKVLIGVSLLGCGLIVLGAFLPIIDFIEKINWLDVEGSDIYIILAMAGLSLPLIAFGQFRFLFFTGLIAIGIVVINYMDIQDVFGSDAIALEGWASLFAGSALLIVMGLVDFVQRRGAKNKGAMPEVAAQ